jgi:hypothetical protein
MNILKAKRKFNQPVVDINKTTTIDLTKIDINNYDDVSKISFGMDSISDTIKTKLRNQDPNVFNIKL